jgi:arginine exporter protein ArgO
MAMFMLSFIDPAIYMSMFMLSFIDPAIYMSMFMLIGNLSIDQNKNEKNISNFRDYN